MRLYKKIFVSRFTNKKNCHKICGKIFVCIKIVTTPPTMKKENSIRTLIGITQQELAMILGVSRSQLAMFETGKRDLPLPAQQLLAEILTHLQSTPTKTAKAATPEPTIPQLEALLHANEYQLLLSQRKTAAAQRKQQLQNNRAKLAEFLNARPAGKSAPALPNLLTTKMITEKSDPSTILIEQQLKQELLKMEQALLESKLHTLRAKPDSTRTAD